ncbi:nucleotidyltransferase domain-containing protein [Paenibacillus sp. OV219]|uniref:nucleotidyltransferase domain-containing protein n=1 Tax=Paenibacillus sp. OV219 TaxID=1884377 RepID=UPI0008D8C335|nr:nucleotidyltransferase domain-containing protein [Paenibacillus sp. OV219]SEO03401.1 Nucleotidyltransferase domain-containing protein [Paenibacillus sp. OV219]
MRNLQAGYGLDSNGFIVSDVGLDKIANSYLPCIRETVENLQKLFPRQLHSIYVYGSVARGEAVARKSDLDILAMFDGDLSPGEIAALKHLSIILSQKYVFLVREVGIAVGNCDYAFAPENYYEQAFLKELCVCVHGDDIRGRFGPYKLIMEIAISFNGDILEAFTRTITRLEQASNEEFNSTTQSFARKLIRTYYSMLMQRSQIWTTRLHEQSEVIIHYFHDKESIVRTLQQWIEEPPPNRNTVLDLFKREGKWASDNFVVEACIS